MEHVKNIKEEPNSETAINQSGGVVILENSPVGESESNGSVECAI